MLKHFIYIFLSEPPKFTLGAFKMFTQNSFIIIHHYLFFINFMSPNASDILILE